MADKQNNAGKLGVIGLACIVVSSMVGGGVFSLPQNMAAGASAGAVLLAWLITGVGMYFIANTFSVLSRVKPNLTAGIYMYAREGFGPYVGFTIGWGYWLCQIFGNVGYAVITMDALNYFFPPYFAGGNNLLSIVCGSVLIWGFNWVVLRGVRQAAILNILGTIGKLVPLLLFCLILLFVFHLDKFDFNFWGHLAENGKNLGSLSAQLKSTMLVTLWAFIGIEGAVVLSNRAKSQAAVSKATFLGFVGCLVVYMGLSLLPYGFLTQEEIAAVANPSTAGVLEQVVGPWGAWVMNIGLLIAVLSSWLALALPDSTTAPSIPINAQRVTSIVLFNCAPKLPKVLPSSAIWPQKLKSNLSKWNTKSIIRQNSNIGTNLPTVPITFKIAAWRTPRNTTKLNTHISTEPHTMDKRLFPPAKYGGKK